MSRDACPKCQSTSALGQYKCFKCGYRVEYALGTYRQLSTFDNAEELELPEQLVYNPRQFHIDALLWLHTAHLYERQIVRQRIAYCPDIHRVFIPCITNGELISYELRKLRDEDWGPKYKAVGRNKQPICYNDFPDSSSVVVVEDHLSAIRLRETTNVVSICGTCISQDTAKMLLNNYTDVIFWLDPDEAGIKAFRKGLDYLRKIDNSMMRMKLFCGNNPSPAVFKVVDYRKIDKDPKKLGLIEVQHAISNAVNCEVFL
tara:strand:+ start:361 stop:1137 length:777 start_codon:yes stop_codon:yes gene_type:complete